MATYPNLVLTAALFLGFPAILAGDLAAQGTNRTPNQPALTTGVAGASGVTVQPPKIPSRRRYPLAFDIQIDAMAFIDEWRDAQQISQIETPRRSGVRINGTRVGSGATGREVLFACTGNAFLDLTIGTQQPDGSVRVDDGPSVGCDPRQALVLNGDRLACNWYSPRAVRPGVPVADGGAEILLGTVPPVSIVGQCITGTAQVVPALVFPDGQTRRVGTRPTCRGSGVTVNGRVTGQVADCLR